MSVPSGSGANANVQGYTVPPPSYASPSSSAPKKAYGATAGSASEPLLGQPRDWDDEAGGNPEDDDFKIGVTVSQSSADVRAAFVRKVYSVLFVQLVRPSPFVGFYSSCAR